MSNPLLAPYPHPGKYEGELNLVEALDALDFGADEDMGDTETFGHYQLFTGLDSGEFGDLGNIVAAILETTSQGFVGAAYYTTEAEARAAWAALESEYADFAGDEDNT